MRVETVIARLTEHRRYLNENWSLSPESAKLLHLVARIGRCHDILEVGTSIGFSTLHLAWAAAEHGGHVTSIEASPERQAQARRHIDEAGLSATVSLRLGSAIPVLDTLVADKLQFDMVFLDARKKEYADYFRFAQMLVRPGGILVADNTRSHRDKMTDFIAAVQSHPDWRSCDIETPNGFVLAHRNP